MDRSAGAADTRQIVQQEKHRVDEEQKKQNSAVEEILERAAIPAPEKERLQKTLREKDREIEEARVEIARMRARSSTPQVRLSESPAFLVRYLLDKVGSNLSSASTNKDIAHEYEVGKGNLPIAYLRDARRAGLLDESNRITRPGFDAIRKALRREN